MNKCKITHRGWAGHLCVSRDCLFHLNTLVEFDGKQIIVSTIGNYMASKDATEATEIGYHRTFETMAFYALPPSPEGFIDADTSFGELTLESEWAYMEETKANEGHFAVVKEIENRLLAGDFEKR